MFQRNPEWLRWTTLAGLVVFAAACGDDPAGPGSDDPFDPAATSQDFAAFGSALENNDDVVQDLEFVGAAMDTLAGGGTAWVLEESISVPGEHPVVEAIRTSGMSLSGGAAMPFLPADLLGTTFVWDEGEEGYVASALAGAPANGVRFLTYDRTQVPFVENGYLDVVDNSDASGDRLSVYLEKNGVPRLDYDLEVIQNSNGGSVGVEGFVSDGTQQVDFDVLETVTASGENLVLDLDYELSLAGQSQSVGLEYQVTFGETSLSGSFLATFVNGANVLELDFTQDGEGTIDGSVRWNGELVMTMTDDGTGMPEFLGPEGEALTQAEADAIEEMFELASEGLFFLLSNVVFLVDSLA